MKILSRILFRENEVFNFFFEHLVDDNGHEVKEFFILEPKKIRQNRVAGVCIIPVVDCKIGLVEVYRPALKRNCWEIPRGFINDDETDRGAALRELQEETGIIAEEINCKYLGCVAPEAGIIGATISVYFSHGGAATFVVKSELGLEQVKFFNMVEVREMVDNSIISDAITLAAILKYLSLQEKIEWTIEASDLKHG